MNQPPSRGWGSSPRSCFTSSAVKAFLSRILGMIHFILFSRRDGAMRSRLEHYFGFAERGTDWRTEILAGFTTFITMAYIIFVNPAILHETGMPIAAVTAATCLCAAFGSVLMGAACQLSTRLGTGDGAERLLHLHGGEGHACSMAGQHWGRSFYPV